MTLRRTILGADRAFDECFLVETDEGRAVNAMIDLTGELANADLFGLAALRALPGATYHAPTGGRAVTRATVGDGLRAQRLEIIVREDGTAEPAHGLARMPPAAMTSAEDGSTAIHESRCGAGAGFVVG